MSQSNGKFIITGEHSVVYGEPALVCELNKTISIKIVQAKNVIRSKYESFIFIIFSKTYKKDASKLKIIVSSDLPEKSGLGSSAAFAHAVLKSLAEYFNIIISKDEMFKLVYKSEVFMHKNPSGIDPFAVVYGGCHLFKKNLKTNKFENEKISLSKKYDFLLVNSGEAKESTGKMVAKVSELIKRKDLRKIIVKIGQISREIINQLANGSFDGKLLDENQNELEKLGVVGLKAKQMIDKIKKLGANAKITGAGGNEVGSGWLLVYHEDLNKIISFCKQNSWEYIKTRVK